MSGVGSVHVMDADRNGLGRRESNRQSQEKNKVKHKQHPICRMVGDIVLTLFDAKVDHPLIRQALALVKGSSNQSLDSQGRHLLWKLSLDWAESRPRAA